MGAIYINTNGDLKACMAILRMFEVLEWVETALENNIQIRYPKEEVDRLAGYKKVRYHGWIEDIDDYDPGPIEELVDAVRRGLPWEKGGIGIRFPLAKANSVVLRGGIGLTWRQPQLKRLYRSSRVNDCPGI